VTALDIRPASPPPPAALRREVGLPGAVLLGLGSIVGTGVFVSIGVAAGVAGPAVLAAIALAAVLATFNGLSSARLAATFPVSGGTYEYGHRTLTPTLGFVAGWTFLCAKTASAATAALGCVGYGLAAAGVAPDALHPAARPGGAVVIALCVTALVAGGIRRSNRANAAIVTVTLLALGAFVVTGLPALFERSLTPFVVPAAGRGAWAAVLEATALMFVAFTGYGRIATLGEEVRDPARTIPRAIVVTLVVSAALYLLVGAAYVGGGGAGVTSAPLAAVARSRAVVALLTVGALTAMVGVLLNLVLGLSRVVLAMARRGDAPRALSHIDPHGSPRGAVLVVGGAIAALTLTGDVRLTWSFSAFTVLVYYAVTNLAALRLPAADLRLPRVVPALGLTGCLGLAFFVDVRVWAVGLAVVALGLALRAVARARSAS
jgi:APA family basic amino acid/polyamine antiporter